MQCQSKLLSATSSIVAASGDCSIAAHQQASQEWWEDRRRTDCYVSQVVIDDATAGDPKMKSRFVANVNYEWWSIRKCFTSCKRRGDERFAHEVFARNRFNSNILVAVGRL